MVLRRSGGLVSIGSQSRHLYDNSTRSSSKARYGVRLRLGASPINRLCNILYRILNNDFAAISSFGRHGIYDCFAAAPRNSLGDISAMRRLDHNRARLASVRGDGESSSGTSGPGCSSGNVSRLIAGNLHDDGAWPFTVSGGDRHRLSRSASPRHGSRDAVWVPSWDFHNLGSWAPSRRRNCDRLSRRAIPRLCSGHAISFWDGNSRRHVSWDS
jgi:hypothetical protein